MDRVLQSNQVNSLSFGKQDIHSLMSTLISRDLYEVVVRGTETKKTNKTWGGNLLLIVININEMLTKFKKTLTFFLGIITKK